MEEYWTFLPPSSPLHGLRTYLLRARDGFYAPAEMGFMHGSLVGRTRGGCVGALGWVRVWMALAACLDRCCVAGRGGRVNHCTATPFGRLLGKPRLSLSLILLIIK